MGPPQTITGIGCAMTQCLLVFMMFVVPSSVFADFESAVETYRQNNYLGALKAFTPLAEAGDPRAQTVLALMYKYGEGTQPNLRTSYFWYLRAAKLNYPPAQYHVGVYLAEGIGTPVELSTAIEWLQKSASRGYQRAADKLEELNASSVDRITKSEPLAWSKNWDFSLPNDIQFFREEAPDSRASTGSSNPGYYIQFGAMSSEVSAHLMWDTIGRLNPGKLIYHSLLIRESEQSERTLYRVQTGPFESIKEARALCGRLTKNPAYGCLPVKEASWQVENRR